LKVLGSKILFALKKRCFTRVILRLLHIAILEPLSRRLIAVEMTLQVEYVEAKSPKRLVQYLNSFLEHIDKRIKIGPL
jgi:hypothetical protein